MMPDSRIVTIPVPPETVNRDNSMYGETPLRYEIELNESIPSGCIISGWFESRWDESGERLYVNISARRLVVMLLEQNAKLAKLIAGKGE